MVDMVNRAVSYLGPDLEVLEKELIALGRRHMRVGAQVEDLAYMGCAVQSALEHILGEKFSNKERLAWAEVLTFMVEKMTVGMLDF